ncbi:MAG: hypothetical protein A4E69_00498 [Syntrophus sp. PtaB.Bin138]|nr:MAG: hypothetical protein A4E69_00498 [Syntrophus sp. PtaB.Bin138]
MNEALREEGVFTQGNPVHRFREGSCIRNDVVDLLLEHLGVKQLLGILPVVERLALVESLVALDSNQLPVQGPSDGFGQFGLSHTGRPFHKDRLVRRCRQKNHHGDFRG